MSTKFSKLLQLYILVALASSFQRLACLLTNNSICNHHNNEALLATWRLATNPAPVYLSPKDNWPHDEFTCFAPGLLLNALEHNDKEIVEENIYIRLHT